MESSEKRLWEHIAETAARLATMDGKLDNLLRHAELTNGRVHKLEVAYTHLERDIDTRDSKLEKLIMAVEKTTKIWALKAIIAVTLLGSFVWIKESRDAIIAIIKMIV